MQKTIYVLEGSYRNKLIENQTFQLVKPYQPHPHKEGGYITVKVNPEDYAGATSDKIKDCLSAFSAKGPRTIERTAGATG